MRAKLWAKKNWCSWLKIQWANSFFMLAYRVVCCSHQSDHHIRVCILHQLDYHIIGYVSCTNQIAAFGYVSCTNQTVPLGYVSCSNHITAFGCLSPITAFRYRTLANDIMDQGECRQRRTLTWNCVLIWWV